MSSYSTATGEEKPQEEGLRRRKREKSGLATKKGG